MVSNNPYEIRYLYHSPKSAETWGHCVATVPDDKGGRVHVSYTEDTADSDASRRLPSDVVLVWSGMASDIIIIRGPEPVAPTRPERGVTARPPMINAPRLR